MKTRNSFLLYVCLPVFGFIVGSLISYNLTPERTPQHTSTVSGTSGDLICTSSCTTKPKQ
jgi:hypothetical protein